MQLNYLYAYLLGLGSGLLSTVFLYVSMRLVMKDNRDLRDRLMSKDYTEFTDGVAKREATVLEEPEYLTEDNEGEDNRNTVPIG